jgi:Cu(I)/Ag(I) efflux system membrane fusion protein
MTTHISLTRPQLLGAAMALTVVAAGLGYGVSHVSKPKPEQQAETADRKVLYWYDPMVPGQHFDKPGKSPFMDMELVPRYADDTPDATSITIDPARLQSLGLRLATVQRSDFAQDLAVAGTLEFNQRDIAIVQAKADGFVQRVYARAPGDIIQAGAPIADILVPAWAGAQAEYLAVRRTNDPALERAARQRLMLLGMSPELVDQVARTNRPHNVVSVSSPLSGALQALDVRQGMTVSSGQTLAQVSGLSTVWLTAAVPEAMAAQTDVGQQVTAELAAFPGESFTGRVNAILPVAQTETRTLSLRVELPNRGGRLKPGMYATVHLAGNATSALAVPTEALIRTGKRTIVMLSTGNGKFRPVEVQVGRESAGRTEVLAGLAENDKVVASGQFLIDSEASLAGLNARPLTANNDQPAAAMTYQATGRIEKISSESVTLSHGPVPELQWPAMTMQFKLATPALAKGLKTGDRVKFDFVQMTEGPVVQSIVANGGAQ